MEHPIESIPAEAKIYDLTQSQSLIWTGQILNPDSPIYNMAFTFAWNGAIDETRFKKAFSLLIAQCDAMRTVIEIQNEFPKQKVFRALSYDLEVLDFSNKNDKQDYLNSWVRERSQRSFDLAKIMFDSVLIKMGKAKYAWYLNQHHLITDGWSKAIQYNLMSDLYKSTLSENHNIDFLIPQFSTYLYEEKSRSENIGSQTLAHWKSHVASSPKAEATFGKSNFEMNSRANRYIITLDIEKSQALKALTLQSDLRAWTTDLSLFNIFSTLLFVLASRLSSEEIITIGTPVHNRSNNDFKNTVGLFIELFPLSVSVEDGDSFISLFKKVQQSSFDFLKYAQTGASNAALSKTFNTVLNYINVSFEEFDNNSVNSEWIHTGHADPAHHLKLQVFDFDNTGEVTLSFDINNTVFDEDQRQKIPKLFETLLDRFVDDRSQQINEISAQDLASIARFNSTDVDFPNEKTIVDLFEEQVLRTPNDVAIIFEEHSLSYQALNEKANQLAHFLLGQGIEIENKVAICLERSLEMMIGLLGILKAGAAYVPVDPTYPKDRIHFILEDSGADLLLTTKDFEAKLSNTWDIEVLAIHAGSNQFGGLPKVNPAIGLSASNLIYVMYTSGSTGRPKGVMNQYTGVVNRLLWAQHYFKLDAATDTVLQKTTFCFDLSVWELFWPLFTGVKLVLARPGGEKDSAYLKSVIRKWEVTTMHFVPSMLDVFLLDFKKGDCPSLRRVLCGGEALKANHVNMFKEKLPQTQLYNLYGPTEAALDVTCWKIPSTPAPVTLVPIGAPIANTQLYILNKQGKQQPIGVAGELCIAGIQVARAYHKRPKLNAERFIKNPFDTQKNTRIYKTGDIARWMPDGNIEFLGRNDNQVKIRGFRIELGEIELALNEIDQISQGVVLAIPDLQDKPRLTAYVVTDQMDESAFREQLAARLPEYMIPTFFMQVDHLPLNSNGKLDRKSLPLPDFSRLSSSRKYIAPEGEFETMVADIWMDILQLEKISAADHFIELGGDSLSGIRVMARINDSFELELPVSLIFSKTNVQQLAQHIETTIRQLMMEMDKD